MEIKPDLYIPRPRSESKYLPHQSKREARRRLRQIAAGTLKGPETFISVGVRYAAIGLTDPNDMTFIVEPK